MVAHRRINVFREVEDIHAITARFLPANAAWYGVGVIAEEFRAHLAAVSTAFASC